MDEQIITIYCLCDDLLRALQHVEDPQCRMNDAEVMTSVLVAAVCFGGNSEQARVWLSDRRYIPNMLSKSRFIRRLHRLESLFLACFETLGEVWKRLNGGALYILDSFPIAACDNYRIRRNRLYHDDAHRGYIASKKRYFYGVRIHLLVTEQGEPVEFFLLRARVADVNALHCSWFDLPAGSTIYADGAYNDASTEQIAAEAQIQFQPQRKKNMHQQFPPWIRFLQAHFRKRIETIGSLLE